MDNKWILITGGTRGIGLTLVSQLLQKWNVVFTGRSEVSVAQAINKVKGTSTSAWVKGFCCDGCDEENVEKLATMLINDLGAPLAIIHNAGITNDALHIHQNANDWRYIMDNNIISVINWNRLLLPAMMTQGRGSIVLMSSISALKGNCGQTAYAASKAAMIGLTHSLAREVGRFGIRVNCLAPGLIESDMLTEMPAEKLKALRQNIPLRRVGRPEDVANAVEFLTGPESSYITGQVLIIDGGLSA
ncbi:SDR family NAD(P)-dependent oxidoreductase [Citrobacter koseri]|uniref:SDR family NAD(P)-dependent oxidoreductase n=1 Tax=Citrobacter koseri TaxID=545 RepID=UPI00066901F5|nr:SDR family oxidoreductase [Citrobacter koseri]HEM6801123.1 SDR family oxidoreductase [Citrobacter koseri]